MWYFEVILTIWHADNGKNRIFVFWPLTPCADIWRHKSGGTTSQWYAPTHQVWSSSDLPPRRSSCDTLFWPHTNTHTRAPTHTNIPYACGTKFVISSLPTLVDRCDLGHNCMQRTHTTDLISVNHNGLYSLGRLNHTHFAMAPSLQPAYTVLPARRLCSL